jgi:energy-converting hydrogenase B subunit D
MIVLVIVLGLIMFAGAIAVLFQKSLKKAVITFGVISLTSSVMFALMRAYDVAITEASIGAVLTIALFFWAIRRLEEEGYNDNGTGAEKAGEEERGDAK